MKKRLPGDFSLLWLAAALPWAVQAQIPDDFPRFTVPGHEQEMATLRALYWLHYRGCGPKATLWDEWLSGPALWPAVSSDPRHNAAAFRTHWSAALSGRIIDPEGYVATHQHASIAHQLGWPFPFWNQGSRGYGWHFSFKDTVGPPWRPGHLNKPDGWTLSGARDTGTNDYGWSLELTAPEAVVTTPSRGIDTFQAPFLQLRWKTENLGRAQPFIAWRTKAGTNFTAERRMYFEPPEGAKTVYSLVPMFRHPQWTGEIAQLRIGLGNAAPGAKVTVQAFFTTFDTRHNINSQNFIRGCATYFWWTRDLEFLRKNLNRMRTALRHAMTEHQALERKVVFTGWVGHDGRTGLKRTTDGKKQILHGHGIGNNYWDLLPFGNLDCYATIHYFDALRFMAAIEREVRARPEWQMPLGVLAFDPAQLEQHAAEVKAAGNRLFWSARTGRFVACVDADGQTHDYGFTFLNLEAVHYDFATPEHAKAILSWVDGGRVIEGDTSKGADIYHWRFGPRATTRRNIDWYFWGWTNPESIAFGGQVQDGGAVLGFSYHDLMSRLKVLGPDNAWKRLQEIIRWFDEVQAAGGYRKYYDGKSRPGTLQGGGTAGGLGLDQEFFESVLVPQVMLNGFLGFRVSGDGFSLDPKLPSAWPELTIDRIRFHDTTLRIRATAAGVVECQMQGGGDETVALRLPEADYKVTVARADGARSETLSTKREGGQSVARLRWPEGGLLRVERDGVR
jgi:hypothetical protein